jgi:hypothetical protein
MKRSATQSWKKLYGKSGARPAAKMEALAAGIADKLLTDLESVTWDNKAATVLGIATDKWLALTGQAQTITESRVRRVD